jgi:hypothetical protein
VRELPRLDADEARHIAGAVCGRYHRTLDPEILQVLLEKRLGDGRLSAGIPLWLELALEELNLLDADDFARAERDYTQYDTPEERLHRMMLDVAQEFPADVEGLYGHMLQRTEELFGVGWSRGFAALIAVSRSGWRESDLQALLPQAAELFEPDRPAEPWDGLRFAGLRRSFRAHLVQRGGQGQWDFFHAQMRLAVGRRSLGDDPLVRRLHTLVADHLESLPADDPQRQGELMFHLIGTDDRLRAARYYASGTPDYDSGSVSGETRALADHVLAGVAEGAAAGSPEANPGLRWVLALLDLADLEPSHAARLANRYQFDLLERLENETGLDTRLTLLIATRACLSRLSAADPGNAGWQRDLCVSLCLWLCVSLCVFHGCAGVGAKKGSATAVSSHRTPQGSTRSRMGRGRWRGLDHRE